MAEIIAYYRVCTTKQGQSGLGLEGQKTAVEAYAKQSGARILASYSEFVGRAFRRNIIAKELEYICDP